MPNSTQVIRLALAEDQSIFRNGVIASLKPYPHIEVVCAAENGKSLLSQLGTTQPDIVLLDMKMPDMDGVEVCKAIKSFNPTIHVIGLSVYDHHYYISSLFEAGGSGYLLKDVVASEIVHAIEVTYKDGAYFSDSLSLPLVQKLMDINHPSIYFSETEASPLKPYEIELLRLIAKEFTANEIADKMALSKRTVENYKALLMTKWVLKTPLVWLLMPLKRHCFSPKSMVFLMDALNPLPGIESIAISPSNIFILEFILLIPIPV